MKKISFLKTSIFSLALLSAAAFANSPAEMKIVNSTGFTTNAYVHNMASTNVLGPYSSESIPWQGVTGACHGMHPPLLGSSDPCAFEVYATNDSANPKQIDVGTVLMYLSDGHVAHIDNKAMSYGLKIRALAPGAFEMDSFNF